MILQRLKDTLPIAVAIYSYYTSDKLCYNQLKQINIGPGLFGRGQNDRHPISTSINKSLLKMNYCDLKLVLKHYHFYTSLSFIFMCIKYLSKTVPYFDSFVHDEDCVVDFLIVTKLGAADGFNTEKRT